MAGRLLDASVPTVREVGSTKLFARTRELYKEEATMADFLAELLFAGLRKVNPSLPAILLPAPIQITLLVRGLFLRAFQSGRTSCPHMDDWPARLK